MVLHSVHSQQEIIRIHLPCPSCAARTSVVSLNKDRRQEQSGRAFSSRIDPRSAGAQERPPFSRNARSAIAIIQRETAGREADALRLADSGPASEQTSKDADARDPPCSCESTTSFGTSCAAMERSARMFHGGDSLEGRNAGTGQHTTSSLDCAEGGSASSATLM